MTNFTDKLRTLYRPYITDNELAILLAGSANSRYSKTKRLIADGKLLHIRRGLYCLTKKVEPNVSIHPFELAQYIYGPSYISLESALSFHQLIPEMVYTITSCCSKRSKEFSTPLGQFSYLHLPLDNFYLGTALVKENENQFLVATPWKAICDYIYCYRKDWRSLKPLIESLRINTNNLPYLSYEEKQSLENYYQHKRMSHFLKGVNYER